ncbi:hypothetical protein HPE43_16235 [Escherichia coli]|nr:hypothetical protein HPE43_16235 [Escherichia coli]
MMRPEKQRRPFPSAWTVQREALTALSSLHCSIRQRLITSCPDRRHCFR